MSLKYFDETLSIPKIMPKMKQEIYFPNTSIELSTSYGIRSSYMLVIYILNISKDIST